MYQIRPSIGSLERNIVCDGVVENNLTLEALRLVHVV